MSSTHDLIARLTHEYPEFQPMLDERSRDGNLGELLPPRTEPGGQIVNQLGPLLAEVAAWLDQSR